MDVTSVRVDKEGQCVGERVRGKVVELRLLRHSGPMSAGGFMPYSSLVLYN